MKRIKQGVVIVGATVLFAGCNVPQSGEVCATENEQWCNDSRVVLTCTEGSWQAGDKVDEYTCDCINDNWNGCAIPGFVGIAEAGRSRRSSDGLRSRFVGALPMLV